MERIEGDFRTPTGRIALLAARFNELIVERLISGARDALLRHGVSEDELTLVRVPGAFEMPLAAEKLAASGRYSGIIALGCVIRGATPHFEHVAGGATNGLMQVSLDYGIPVGFGLLTTNDLDQALDRAGGKSGNKGSDAALAVIEQMNLLQQLEPQS